MKPQIINKYIYVKGKKISEVDSKGYNINGNEYVPIVFDDNNARTTIDAIAAYANSKADYLTKEDLDGLVPTLDNGKIDSSVLPDELKTVVQDLQNEVNARVQGDNDLSNRLNEQLSSLQQSISSGDDSVRTAVNKRIDDLQNTLQAADQSNTDAINKVQQNLNDYKGTIESQLDKYVTKAEDGEEITGRKVFKKLPQSDIAPTESSHLTNKNYVDIAIQNASVNISANKVTLDTAQTISGLKTFTKLPQSSVRPQDDKDLVNKAYVDSMASNAFVVFEEDLKGSEYSEDKYNDLTNALNSNKSVVVYSNGDIVLSSVDVENDYIKITLHKGDVHDNDIIVSKVSYTINKANRAIVTVANDITLNTDQESNKYLSADGTYNTPTKETVGLDKVDNTSDADKPISTATQEAIDKVQSNLDTHISDKNNPHEVTKDQVGLGNVDNTADIDKPVSTAQKEYIDDRVSTLTDTLSSTVEQHTTDIKNLNDQLAQERTDRAQSEEIIQKSIDNLQTELQDEINNRTEADTNLNSKIESEITVRTEEDKKLSDRIDKEVSDRTSADEQLQSNIDDLDSKVDQSNTSLNNKIEQEITNRTEADNTINQTINEFKEETTNNFTTVNQKIDNISENTGKPGGSASLDENGKVPSSQLPSYVDDVLEYENLAAFPQTGESGKIYVALDSNLTYRWSGTKYVEISPSLALGETSSTAFAGDRGKAVEDRVNSWNKSFSMMLLRGLEWHQPSSGGGSSLSLFLDQLYRTDTNDPFTTRALELEVPDATAQYSGAMSASDKSTLDTYKCVPFDDAFPNGMKQGVNANWDLIWGLYSSSASNTFIGNYRCSFSGTPGGIYVRVWRTDIMNHKLIVYSLEITENTGRIQSVIPFEYKYAETDGDGNKYLANDGEYHDLSNLNVDVYLSNINIDSTTSISQQNYDDLKEAVDNHKLCIFRDSTNYVIPLVYSTGNNMQFRFLYNNSVKDGIGRLTSTMLTVMSDLSVISNSKTIPLLDNGDGTKYLSDDGTYKEIDLSNYVDNDTLNTTVSELDNKYLPLTGGTLTGELNVDADLNINGTLEIGINDVIKNNSTSSDSRWSIFHNDNYYGVQIEAGGTAMGTGLNISNTDLRRINYERKTSYKIYDEGNVSGSKVTTNDISGGLNITSITQSAYDELSSKDANTLYIITE